MLNSSASVNNSYTDLSSVNAIRSVGLTDKGKALDEISKQFESMMVRMMLKSMRDANSVFAKDNYLTSNEGDTYLQMYDDQLALSLTEGKGIGIAQIMAKQLKSRFQGEKDSAELGSPSPVAAVTSSKNVPTRTSLKSTSGIENAFVLGTNNAMKNGLTPAPIENRDSTNAKIGPVKDQLIDRSGKTSSQHTHSKNTQGQNVISQDKAAVEFDGSIKQFVENVHVHAVAAAKELGVEPLILIAQSALETGWGQKISKKSNADSSFNLFNIKADKRWQGDEVVVPTIEFRNGLPVKETASFRSYPSVQHSFEDYVNFISDNPRYESALVSNDSEHYIQQLSESGYATDPQYAEKVIRIASSAELKQALSNLGALPTINGY